MKKKDIRELNNSCKIAFYAERDHCILLINSICVYASFEALEVKLRSYISTALTSHAASGNRIVRRYYIIGRFDGD